MSMNLRGERGFTLAELMVATMVTMLVLGGAVVMTSQVQTSFRKQIEDSAGEQEGRYALEWISRLIRAAGNNPFGLPLVVGATASCPVANSTSNKRSEYTAPLAPVMPTQIFLGVFMLL